MKKTINNQKSNVLITLGAAVVIILITGGLGLGQYLNNRLAFGYGGGVGFVIAPITAINNPLVLSEVKNDGGRLFRNFDNALVEVEVPPLAVDEYAIFDIQSLGINDSNNVCLGDGNIIGDAAFTIFAKDINNQPINKFDEYLSVSITMAGLPVNSPNLGVYYLNSNQQWVFGGQALFNVQNSKVTFRTQEAGTFAIINTNGLPRLIESQSRCSGVVLGVSEFANGSILRTCDAQLYIIEESIAKSIGRLDLVHQTYNSEPVFDVDYDTIVRYTPAGQGPQRQKNYNIGDLLRTCDYKIYRVEGENADTFRHITTHEELQARFEGQVINNVDYWQIAKYRDLNYSPTPTAVLGSKIYDIGTLIRTTDKKVYVVEEYTVRHLVTLDQDVDFFAGQPIFDVSYEALESHRNRTSGDGQVLGVKQYGDGALLRTRDWSVYRVENGQIRKIASLPGASQTTYEGQKINDVDYGTLSQFTDVNDTPLVNPTQQVLGVKVYADGTLLRTPDGKIYIVRNSVPFLVASLEELQNYAGQNIINISQAELLEVSSEVTTGGRVLGAKKYGDGSLLKTPDWKVYEVKGDSVHHIATYPGSGSFYQGRKIFNVSFEGLSQYQKAQ